MIKLEEQMKETLEMLKCVKESATDVGDNKTLLEGISFDSFVFVMSQVESLIDWLWWFK